MWIWKLHASSRYNVTSVYNSLTSRNQPLENNQPKTIWHKEVHLKVNIFTQRLLCNRFPTTNNLIRRKVLQPNTDFCWGGCGCEEDIDNLILTCDYFGKIWLDIYN